MSFDLYFCSPPAAQLDHARLHQCIGALEHVTESRSDDGSLTQFEYNNPDTGVYCLFDIMTASEAKDYEPPELLRRSRRLRLNQLPATSLLCS